MERSWGEAKRNPGSEPRLRRKDPTPSGLRHTWGLSGWGNEAQTGGDPASLGGAWT